MLYKALQKNPARPVSMTSFPTFSGLIICSEKNNQSREEPMKRFKSVILAASMAAGLFAVSDPAFAKVGDQTVDVGVSVATEPIDNLGTAIGFSGGFGYEFTKDTQIRADVSYYSWDDSQTTIFGTMDMTVYRIPIAVSARRYVDFPNQQGLRAYGQLGLELSIDGAEVTLAGVSADDSETNVGLTPAAGIEYNVNDQMFVGANAAYHIITDSYFTFGGSIGFRF